MKSEGAGPPQLAHFTVGGWHVRPFEGVVERAGERRHLRPKSMDVLVLLASRPRSTVPRDDFLRQVWEDQFVDDASLARCIGEIRAALGDDARDPRFVETVPRRGYRLIAPVGDGTPRGIPAPAGGQGSEAPAAEAEPRRRRRLPVLAALIAIAGLAFFLGWWRAGRGTAPNAAAEAARPAVAVLSVRNLSGDPARDWLQPALEQMLATELAVSDLGRAVPADVALRAARELSISPSDLADPAALHRLGSALGAAYLVTGSFLVGAESNPEALRFDLMVHDVASGEVIEGIVETGSVQDLSPLVLSAGRRLRGRLGLGEGPANRAVRPSEGVPSRPEAARLYFQALLELRRGEAEDARDLLLRALETDPAAPYAHLSLAEAWAVLGYDSRALASATKALELSASLPAESRLWTEARAYSLSSQWSEAVERLEALRLLAPQSLEYGLALADAQTHRGDFAAALHLVDDLGDSSDPAGTDSRIALLEAEAAAGLGSYERAVEAARRARAAAERVNAPLVEGRALALEARALHRVGDVDAARLALGKAMETFDRAAERREAASARVTLAGWLREEGRIEDGWRIAEAAVEVFSAIGDRKGEAAALREVAGGRWRQGSAAEGEAALLRSIALSHEIGDRKSEADSLNALAVSRATNGGGPIAAPFEQALALYRDIGDRDGVASALGNLGKLALLGGDARVAIERLQEAETVYRELRIPLGRGNSLFNLAYAYLEAAEPARAAATFREITRIFEGLGNDRMVAASLEGLADTLIATGELAEAREHLARCHELRTGLGEPIRIVQGELAEARLLIAEGDLERALRTAEHARDEAGDLPGGPGGSLREAAEATIVEVQLERRRPDLARASLDRLVGLEPDAELDIKSCNRRLLAVRTLAPLGRKAAARPLLESVSAFAASHGLERLRLEAELLRAELGLAAPGSEPAVPELEAELRRRGLVRLAERARALLASASTPTHRADDPPGAPVDLLSGLATAATSSTAVVSTAAW